MKIKNVFIITVLMAMVTMLGPATLVWAGAEGGAPPDWDNVTGPEIWGTAVVHCDPDNNNLIAIRVKRIKDCNVLTDALVLYPATMAGACPNTSTPFLYYRLNPGQIFSGDPDIPQTYTPIVTKIKNFTVHDYQNTGASATLSFDAQIKFVNE